MYLVWEYISSIIFWKLPGSLASCVYLCVALIMQAAALGGRELSITSLFPLNGRFLLLSVRLVDITVGPVVWHKTYFPLLATVPSFFPR